MSIENLQRRQLKEAHARTMRQDPPIFTADHEEEKIVRVTGSSASAGLTVPCYSNGSASATLLEAGDFSIEAYVSQAKSIALLVEDYKHATMTAEVARAAVQAELDNRTAEPSDDKPANLQAAFRYVMRREMKPLTRVSFNDGNQKK